MNLSRGRIGFDGDEDTVMRAERRGRTAAHHTCRRSLGSLARCVPRAPSGAGTSGCVSSPSGRAAPRHNPSADVGTVAVPSHGVVEGDRFAGRPRGTEPSVNGYARRLAAESFSDRGSNPRSSTRNAVREVSA